MPRGLPFARPARAPPPPDVVPDDGRVVLSDRGLTVFPPGALDPAAARGVDAWWTAPEVTWIDVRDNRIPSVPPGIAALAPTLAVLKLAGNPLNAPLTEAIGALTRLRALDVSRCGLTGALPDALGGCEALADLNVSGNALSALPAPAAVARWRRLERLLAADNAPLGGARGGGLPDELARLPLLAELDVAGCGLRALPAALAARGCALAVLRAGRNALMLADVSGAASLRTLDVRQNNLGAGAGGAGAGGAGGGPADGGAGAAVRVGSALLVEAFLGLNPRLRAVPPSLAPAALAGVLATLDASDAGLTSLPAWLSRARGLVTLDVRNNDIAELPPFLGFLPALQHVAVDGNPTRGLKRALVAGAGATADALKAHLRSRASEDEAAAYAAGVGGDAEPPRLPPRAGVAGAVGVDPRTAAAAPRAGPPSTALGYGGAAVPRATTAPPVPAALAPGPAPAFRPAPRPEQPAIETGYLSRSAARGPAGAAPGAGPAPLREARQPSAAAATPAPGAPAREPAARAAAAPCAPQPPLAPPGGERAAPLRARIAELEALRSAGGPAGVLARRELNRLLASELGGGH